MAKPDGVATSGKQLKRVEGYPFRRDLLASIRLYFQHWMWGRQLGYTLNPKIPLQEGARVADVCCGTGIWLLDLAKQHPEIQCDGYDISPDQFPNPGWMPKNVEFGLLDVLKPIPDNLKNQYDVVHVGNLVCVVKNDDPTGVLDNLKLMLSRLHDSGSSAVLTANLEPGGYLQWDDSDFGNLLVSSPDSTVPHAALDSIDHKIHDMMLAANGARYEWVRNLKQYFEKSNMDVIDDRLVIPEDDIALPWTLQHLMATLEVIRTIDQPVGSANDWWDLYEDAVQETRMGASMRMGLVSCVGQK